MRIHKIYFVSTWLIGVQGSATREVLLILIGKGPVVLVDLLRAGRQVCPQTRPPCPPAGRREVREATWLNQWRRPEDAYLLFWQQTRMCHLRHPGFSSFFVSISAAVQEVFENLSSITAERFWVSFRGKEERAFPLLPAVPSVSFTCITPTRIQTIRRKVFILQKIFLLSPEMASLSFFCSLLIFRQCSFPSLLISCISLFIR